MSVQGEVVYNFKNDNFWKLIKLNQVLISFLNGLQNNCINL
jgi:hypothetical protein